jgi:hypothetical protein
VYPAIAGIVRRRAEGALAGVVVAGGGGWAGARRARSFTLLRRLADGRYVVRLSTRAESGVLDRREAVVRVTGGRATIVRSLRKRGGCRV